MTPATHDANAPCESLHELLIDIFDTDELGRWLHRVNRGLLTRINLDRDLTSVAFDAELLLEREGFLGDVWAWHQLAKVRPERSSQIRRLAEKVYGVSWSEPKGSSWPLGKDFWLRRLSRTTRNIAIFAVLVLSTGIVRYYVWRPEVTEKRTAPTFIRKKVDVLIEIAAAASAVAVSFGRQGGPEGDASQKRYEQLYLSHRVLFQDHELMKVMDNLRHELRYFAEGYLPVDGSSARDAVKKRAFAVTDRCNALIESLTKDAATE